MFDPQFMLPNPPMKTLLVLLCMASLLTFSGCIETITEAAVYNDNLAGADYWSDQPEILSAGLGFCDIVAADVDELDEATVLSLGGAWLSDLSCAEADDAALRTAASVDQAVDWLYIGEADHSALLDGALALDGLPIVFSWPVLTQNIHPTDFQFTLNTGEVVTPMYAGGYPNLEYNERNCVVVFGELGNKLPSSDPGARFPVRCEVVDDGTPLQLVGPGNRVVSAVGMSWETTSSPYDPNNGPRLVGAKLNYCGDRPIGEGVGGSLILEQDMPNDEFALYGGGDFRLRMLTTGGFSPDGIRGVKPTDYAKFFRIHVEGPNGTTVTLDEPGVTYDVLGGQLTVIGLSDLGLAETSYDDCYVEDRDNYIDIILEGDEAAARNITFLEIPSLAGGYQAFYNPGGPGTTPTPGESYSQPGPADLEPVIIALDDPMRVNYDGARHGD